MAPVRNENEEVIMVIMNFEDLSEISKTSSASSASHPNDTTSTSTSTGCGHSTQMNRWKRVRSKLDKLIKRHWTPSNVVLEKEVISHSNITKT